MLKKILIAIFTLVIVNVLLMGLYSKGVTEKDGIGYFSGTIIPFTGKSKITYENNVVSERNYRFGKKHGKFSETFPNGKIKFTGNFKNNKQDGLWQVYHENGIISAEVQYQEGKINGNAKAYNDRGKLIVFNTYKNGVIEGPYENYNDNGELVEKGNYINNQKDGVSHGYLDGIEYKRIYSKGMLINEEKIEK